jgi:hypothetical protein
MIPCCLANTRTFYSAHPMIALILLLVALFLSAHFQRAITSPILHLSGVMRKVSEENNYGLKVEATREDEL